MYVCMYVCIYIYIYIHDRDTAASNCSTANGWPNFKNIVSSKTQIKKFELEKLELRNFSPLCGKAELCLLWVSHVLARSAIISPEFHQNLTGIHEMSLEFHQKFATIMSNWSILKEGITRTRTRRPRGCLP